MPMSDAMIIGLFFIVAIVAYGLGKVHGFTSGVEYERHSKGTPP